MWAHTHQCLYIDIYFLHPKISVVLGVEHMKKEGQKVESAHETRRVEERDRERVVLKKRELYLFWDKF